MKKGKLVAMFTVSSVLATTMAVSLTSTTSAAKAAKLKPITFTFFNEDGGQAADWDQFKSPVAKIIKQKTGVTLKMNIPVGDVSQKAGVMLASGKLDDMVYLKGDQNKYVTAKKLVNLSPLINKYGPEVKRLYGKYYNRLKFSKTDKSIYVFPAYGVGDKNWGQSGYFGVQMQALKDQGYPKMKTLDDLEKLIKAEYKKHPTFKGQKVIPLTLLADDWRIYICVNNPATFSAGYPDDGNWLIDPKTYQAKLTFTSKAHHDFYKWLNHMNDIGLLDSEAFIQKEDQYQAKVASGRVIALIDATWGYQKSQAVLKGSMPERMFMSFGLQQTDKTLDTEYRSSGFSPGWGVGITTSCKDPVRAVKFVNWLCSDEAQILNNWGIAGKDYHVVNGKRVLTDADLKMRADAHYKTKSGVSQYLYPFPQRGRGVKDPSGQYYDPRSPEQIQANMSQSEKDTLKSYGVKNYWDLPPFKSEESIAESDWGAAWQIQTPSTGQFNLLYKKLDDLMKASIPDLILGKPSQYEDKWKEFMKKTKEAGAEKYEKMFTQFVKDRVDLMKN